MVKVLGIRFVKAGKIYYFSPAGQNFAIGDSVIVETARGIEFGWVVIAEKEISDAEVVSPLKEILRKATEEDLKTHEENGVKEAKAFEICQQKIIHHKLPIKLIEVSYTFDASKIVFYFTAEGRVDFRDLVKDLASVFLTRIEMRQIGVRDEAKIVGGLATCGRTLCCNSVLGDFQPVSIKMAKKQGLSLNSAKISGMCGRLMCCLKYESYDDCANCKGKNQAKEAEDLDLLEGMDSIEVMED